MYISTVFQFKWIERTLTLSCTWAKGRECLSDVQMCTLTLETLETSFTVLTMVSYLLTQFNTLILQTLKGDK